jgi:hypothetical protein
VSPAQLPDAHTQRAVPSSRALAAVPHGFALDSYRLPDGSSLIPLTEFSWPSHDSYVVPPCRIQTSPLLCWNPQSRGGTCGTSSLKLIMCWALLPSYADKLSKGR